MDKIDVAIIGAGPVGLAAAIAAKRKGLSYMVLEKGVIANSIFHFPTNMVFFTTAELLEIGGHPFPSTLRKPTRQMALDYYRLIVKNEGLNVRLYHEVQSIEGKEGDYVISGVYSKHGQRHPFAITASYVVIATGYFDNPVGLGGIPGEFGSNVSHYYKDPHPYFGMDVVVIGAGNSGAEASLELYRCGAHVTLIHNHPTPRKTIKYWVLPDLMNRISEGSIKSIMPAVVKSIDLEGVVVEYNDSIVRVPADHVFILTGFRPDTTFLSAVGVELDSNGVATLSDNFESNRAGLFLVGSVGFGKFTNSVFIENGRIHATVAIDEISRRLSDPNYVPKWRPLSRSDVAVNH